MKKISNILLAFFLFTVVFSCKKVTDAPAPAATQNQYRLKSIVSVIGSDTNTTIYTYDASGYLVAQNYSDKTGSVLQAITYAYNGDGYLSTYSFKAKGDTANDYTETYEYNANHQVLKKKTYNNATSTPTLKTIKSYYYDTNKQLVYFVELDQQTGKYKDSVVYGNYANGRPQTRRYYQKDINDSYYLTAKAKYSYDARMNNIKIEETKYQDTTTFYTVWQESFTVLDDPIAWLKASSFELSMNYEDAYFVYSKDQNPDFSNGYTESAQCGMSSQVSKNILQKNGVGLPVKMQTTQTLYNCGTFNSTNISIDTLIYEMF
jgi:YD repeat-containing protein